LFPKERKFNYSFSEGKPWHFGLVTAPFDFPVHHVVERVKYLDTDSILPSGEVYQDEIRWPETIRTEVLSDEKIIDRGEIVTPDVYRKLTELKKIYDEKAGTTVRKMSHIVGISILVAGLMLCFLFYLAFFRKKIYARKRDVVFLLSMLAIFTISTEISLRTELFNVYIIPFAIIPIVIRTFFESRTAQMTHLFTILICSLMVSVPFEFLLLQFLVGAVALYVLKDLTKRSELIKCSVYIFGAYTLAYTGFWLLQNGDIAKIGWPIFLCFGINFLFVLFSYSFIYIVEKIFGYISNVTLVELSDINHPALLELSEKAPGTFQHSLQVSMLGTAAATKIGANPQLVRTGALYHDLGKLENPGYFTENALQGHSLHEHLSLEESVRIITKHVPDGVKKAQQYDIPSAIIKFILTHHGRGKAKYFYNTYVNQHPNEPVDEKMFSYNGENPDTKETAILMMADSVEAASHSLKDYTESSIKELVNRIINNQIADGLLSHAPLTFQNITSIKNVFIEKLIAAYHTRISYPEINK